MDEDWKRVDRHITDREIMEELRTLIIEKEDK